MKVLFELINFNSDNIKVIEVLMPKGNSPLRQLFQIVISEENINDNQAMFRIYGSRKVSTFSNLKTQLKDVLIKASLLKRITSGNDNIRAEQVFNQYRYAIATRYFKQFNLNNLAINIAEKAIRKSIKYHSSENVLLLARTLILHYGSSAYDKFKLTKYINIQNKFMRINICEIKAENYFFDLQQNQFKSLATPNSFIIERAKEYVDELEKINDIQTFLFLFNRYRVKATYYEFIRDFESLLHLSDTILKEMIGPDKRTIQSVSSINLRKILALLQLGRNDQTIFLGSKELKKLNEGSLAWYFMAHYKLKAHIYKEDYKNAVDLIRLMIENPLFSKLGGNYRELFTATLGYIHLIVDSGLAGDPKKLKKLLPDFKIGKFLNAIPVFSKDKQGINVSILLMHVAILIQRKNHDAIIDRADSLKQYAYKYLRKDDTFRSNCMIKMVIQMTNAGFNPIRTERYTRDLLKQLEAVKLAGSGENIETEIIPYEVLWTIMKKAL